MLALDGRFKRTYHLFEVQKVEDSGPLEVAGEVEEAAD